MARTNYFAIGYRWIEAGILQTWATVECGPDAATALSNFRSKNPHITECWVIT